MGKKINRHDIILDRLLNEVEHLGYDINSSEIDKIVIDCINGTELDNKVNYQATLKSILKEIKQSK